MANDTLHKDNIKPTSVTNSSRSQSKETDTLVNPAYIELHPTAKPEAPSMQRALKPVLDENAAIGGNLRRRNIAFTVGRKNKLV